MLFRHKMFVGNLIFSFLLLGSGLFMYSCNSTSSKKTTQNSAKVDSLIEKANQILIRSVPKDNRPRDFVDSFFHTIKLTPLDLSKKHKFFAWSYHREDDQKKAHLYADSMQIVLAPFEKEYRLEYAQALLFKGTLFEYESRAVEAFDNFYKARSYAKQHLDSCGLTAFTFQLMVTSYAGRHAKVGERYAKLVINEASYCKNPLGFEERLQYPALALQRMGVYYKDLDQLDSALYYINKSVQLISNSQAKFPKERAKIDFMIANNHVLLGNIYLEQKKYKESENHFKEGIRIMDVIQSTPFMPDLYIGLTEVYLRSSRMDEATKMMHLIDNHALTKYLMASYYGVKKSYFEKKGQIDSAYAYLQKIKSLSDSRAKANSLVEETNMQQAFETTEKKHQLQLLGESNKEKKNYIIIGIFFSAILLATIVGITYSRKRLGKLNLLMSQTIQALEQSQEENALMMRVVAHDLRGPTAATINIAGILLRKQGLSSNERKMLELLEKSSSTSMEMIDDLLMLNASKENLIKASIKINDLLQQCVDLLHSKANDKNIKIRLKIRSETVYGNAEKLWRVFNNLLVNAIKFSHENASIEIIAESRDDQTLISFKDKGIGIPKSMQDKIFSLSPEKNRMGTLGEQSFGLGLFIAKQIVEAHDGKIWAESNGTDGATFLVLLPSI